MNLIDAIKTFPDELACVKYLEKMRWPNGVKCLACESDKVTFYVKKEGVRTRINKKGETVQSRVPARYLYQCKECRKQFTPTLGTLFNDTHLPLRTWFLAVVLMIDAKKGMAANQMKRHLDIGSYRSAWYLCHRVRAAMDELPSQLFGGIVEADETYIGPRRYDERRRRDRWDKEPVFGVIERGGKVKTWHIPRVNRHHVIAKLKDTISLEADLVCTDESPMYKRFPEGMTHEIVNHSAKEWVRGDVHTGSIDGYWGLLKRAIIGSFHQVSIKHLHRYLSEAEYRWNHREEDLFALIVIRLLIASAMPYQKLIKPVSVEPDAGPKVTGRRAVLKLTFALTSSSFGHNMTKYGFRHFGQPDAAKNMGSPSTPLCFA
jgi:transposase-like protein